jgi:phosphoglycerate dehydrogenase-like enzyme
MRRNVVVYVTIPPQVEFYRKALQEKDPEINATVTLDYEEARAAVREADIFLGFGANLKRDFFKDTPRLQWVHALGTGMDGITDSPFIARHVLVTSTRGIHGEPMSEAALMFMLVLARNFRRVLAQQQEQHWQRFFPQLLHGKTVGILGVGLIAEALAPRCKALGMTVVGISRSNRLPPGFDRMVPRADVARAVADLDFLVLLIPYERETHHIVDATVLRAMKRSAFLINLARGGVVDEQALIQALEEEWIAGAALDAFETEPLPKGHVLWTTRNVIVSPHMTGTWDGYAAACFKQFSHNYDCFVAGAPERMINREQIRA